MNLAGWYADANALKLSRIGESEIESSCELDLIVDRDANRVQTTKIRRRNDNSHTQYPSASGQNLKGKFWTLECDASVRSSNGESRVVGRCEYSWHRRKATQQRKTERYIGIGNYDFHVRCHAKKAEYRQLLTKLGAQSLADDAIVKVLEWHGESR